jgi:hypothetical protein
VGVPDTTPALKPLLYVISVDDGIDLINERYTRRGRRLVLVGIIHGWLAHEGHALIPAQPAG